MTTPTHVAGVLDHESGAVTTAIASTDVWPTELPRLEIFGEKGSLQVPDPNFLGGPVRLRRSGATEWSEVPLTHGYAGDRATGWHYTRGLGIAEMAKSIRLGAVLPQPRRPSSGRDSWGGEARRVCGT